MEIKLEPKTLTRDQAIAEIWSKTTETEAAIKSLTKLVASILQHQTGGSVSEISNIVERVIESDYRQTYEANTELKIILTPDNNKPETKKRNNKLKTKSRTNGKINK